jgi:hypothetical protein
VCHHVGLTAAGGVAQSVTLDEAALDPDCERVLTLCQTVRASRTSECQILPLPISRYRFKFQSNLVWDSIKSMSNFCFQF